MPSRVCEAILRPAGRLSVRPLLPLLRVCCCGPDDDQKISIDCCTFSFSVGSVPDPATGDTTLSQTS